MMKHTPGPWQIDASQTMVYAHDGETTIYVADAIHSTEDARIIAAAPELLRQLKDALQMLRWKDPEIVKTAGYKIAESAIRAAEGKGEQS